jgi:hypothetical protein
MSKLAAALTARLAEFENKQAKVGWFESAQYPEGEKVASVALIQEMGAPAAKIPARPFIRPAIKDKGEEWKANIRKGVQAVIKGSATADDVLTIVGAQASGHIRQAISEVREPPLAKRTLEQRKRDGYTDQPLNRTGYMITTLTNIVGAPE